MDLYVVRRRGGYGSLEELDRAGLRSTAESERPGSGVRWIRSYVVVEPDDRLGTVDVYEAESPDALRAHAASADLLIDEVAPVADTILVRPDPGSPRG
jgi:hypothetical protein